ncbi:MAG: hypothetical protein AABX23_05285 [Nanoarchaeota archaeon]
MELRIKIKKRHLFAIIGMIVLVGIVIAYGGNDPQNMGHSDGEIQLTNIGQSLTAWSNSVNSQISGLGGRMFVVERDKSDRGWTAVSQPLPALSFPDGSGVHNPQTASHSYGTSVVPSSAKEVLVYVWASRGSNGGNSGIIHYTISTPEGHAQKFLVVDNNNNGAAVVNSENMWFPITNDRRLIVNLPARITQNYNAGAEIIGYR